MMSLGKKVCKHVATLFALFGGKSPRGMSDWRNGWTKMSQHAAPLLRPISLKIQCFILRRTSIRDNIYPSIHIHIRNIYHSFDVSLVPKSTPKNRRNHSSTPEAKAARRQRNLVEVRAELTTMSEAGGADHADLFLLQDTIVVQN